ncbi:MAG: PhzF family phenazine biosynthesis isomerase [Anaerolineae bacterium]|nr:PhzF family phenazine biosynthesis isomerase [Anaerolineae bacterium]
MTNQSIPLYQVDAFTREPFKGNQAAICLVEPALAESLPPNTMQAIAAEMNLSETAFVQPLEEKPWAECRVFSLRWFTPGSEVPLCGHATLATASILFDEVGVTADAVTFKTLSGDLIVRRAPSGGFCMNFPLDLPRACIPQLEILATLGLDHVVDAVIGERSTMLLLRLKDAAQVRALRPDFAAMRAESSLVPHHGLIVTAEGDAPYDFTSRFFAPLIGIDEDPVTGSAHTLLAPYWTERLGERTLHAYQASARGGEMDVRLTDDGRVELIGQTAFIFQGNLRI